MAASSTSPLFQKLQWVDTIEQVRKNVKELKRQKMIAVDCEGNNLCREGTLDILIIGTVNGKVFLFDITRLGTDAFDAGLRNLLERESEVLTKLMYDCRNDSDALMHHYQVKLAGVLDLQLVEIDRRRKNKKNFKFLKGLKKSIAEYAPDEESERIKKDGVERIERAKENGMTIWDERPLCSELKDYCAVDTVKLFPLLKSLRKGMNKIEILEASKRYADYFRSYETLPESKFYRHGLLPDLFFVRNSSSRDVVYNQCSGCKKEFSNFYLKKVLERKRANFCAVCSHIIIEESKSQSSPS